MSEPAHDGAEEADALVARLRQFAEGGAAPQDVELSVTATAMNVVHITTARLDGDVEVGDLDRRRPRCRARARAEELRAAASSIVASGFPKIRAKSVARASPASPPVRITVRDGHAVVTAELPASRVGESRAFAQAVGAIAKLGDAARQAKPLTQAALIAITTGKGPSGLAIEARLETSADHSRAIELTPQGMLVETERRGARRRRSAVGPAPKNMHLALARVLLEGAYPEGHGGARLYEGEHFVVRVGVEDASVEVTFEPSALEETSAAAKIVRALDTAAARAGGRPLAAPTTPRG